MFITSMFTTICICYMPICYMPFAVAPQHAYIAKCSSIVEAFSMRECEDLVLKTHLHRDYLEIL